LDSRALSKRTSRTPKKFERAPEPRPVSGFWCRCSNVAHIYAPLTHSSSGSFHPQVVTLWYRAPELLLGQNEYGASVDLWSTGCILSELTCRRPLFPGDSEIDQLFRIFRLLGTPREPDFSEATPSSSTSWPGVTALPDYQQIFPQWKPKEFTVEYPNMLADTADLLTKLIVYDPSKRLDADAAMAHPFFAEIRAVASGPTPLVCYQTSSLTSASPLTASSSRGASVSSSAVVAVSGVGGSAASSKVAGEGRNANGSGVASNNFPLLPKAPPPGQYTEGQDGGEFVTDRSDTPKNVAGEGSGERAAELEEDGIDKVDAMAQTAAAAAAANAATAVTAVTAAASAPAVTTAARAPRTMSATTNAVAARKQLAADATAAAVAAGAAEVAAKSSKGGGVCTFEATVGSASGLVEGTAHGKSRAAIEPNIESTAGTSSMASDSAATARGKGNAPAPDRVGEKRTRSDTRASSQHWDKRHQ